MIKQMKALEHKVFRFKVTKLMHQSAIAVMNELKTNPGYAQRSAYAQKILSGVANVDEFAIGVLTNATVSDKIDADQDPTADLPFVVESIFNAYAGYNQNG